ncbi:unnamed protein product [Scytosiphon promiscuus]
MRVHRRRNDGCRRKHDTCKHFSSFTVSRIASLCPVVVHYPTAKRRGLEVCVKRLCTFVRYHPPTLSRWSPPPLAVLKRKDSPRTSGNNNTHPNVSMTSRPEYFSPVIGGQT